MGLFSKLFGHAKPDGLVGCYQCSARTTGTSGHCDICHSPFAAIIPCPVCKWQHGVRDAKLWAYKCNGCGTEIASRLFNQLEFYVLGYPPVDPDYTIVECRGKHH